MKRQVVRDAIGEAFRDAVKAAFKNRLLIVRDATRAEKEKANEDFKFAMASCIEGHDAALRDVDESGELED